MDTTIPDVPQVAFLYKLIVGEKWYIGSSTDTLPKRLKGHYKQAKLTPDRKLYKAVVEEGGWSKVKVEVVETRQFSTLEDLRQRENILIKLEDPNCLNSCRAIPPTYEQKIEKSRESKKRCQEKQKKNPEWLEEQRKRHRELHRRQMENPEYAQRRREVALAYYYRQKEAKNKNALNS